MTDIYNRNLHRTILLRSFGTFGRMHVDRYVKLLTTGRPSPPITDIDSQLWNPWFFFQPFFARSTSIASDIRKGLQLEFKNVWRSKLLTPPIRAATTEGSRD